MAKGRRRDSKKTPHLFSDEEHFLEMEVDFLQPFLDIEARTVLANPGEVAMAKNLGTGIVEGETVEKVFQRFLLGWSASIGRLAFLV